MAPPISKPILSRRAGTRVSVDFPSHRPGIGPSLIRVRQATCQQIEPKAQGLSIVIFASDQGRGLVGSGCVSAEGGGFVLDGVAVEQMEGKVSQGGREEGRRPSSHAAVIFAHGHVADVEHTVLDAPATRPPVRRRMARSKALRSKAANRSCRVAQHGETSRVNPKATAKDLPRSRPNGATPYGLRAPERMATAANDKTAGYG